MLPQQSLPRGGVQGNKHSLLRWEGEFRRTQPLPEQEEEERDLGNGQTRAAASVSGAAEAPSLQAADPVAEDRPPEVCSADDLLKRYATK